MAISYDGMPFWMSYCDCKHMYRPPFVAKGWPAIEIRAYFESIPISALDARTENRSPTHLSPMFTMSYQCFCMPVCKSFSKPGTHILWNRDHICSGLILVWPRFHWCWIEPASAGSRACWMCVCAYATLKFSVPRSLCVTHGAPAYGCMCSVTTKKCKEIPHVPPTFLTAPRYCAQTNLGFELFHQTVNQRIFPVKPSTQPCQWRPNRNHLSC
jgi:hypothetical protein